MTLPAWWQSISGIPVNKEEAHPRRYSSPGDNFKPLFIVHDIEGSAASAISHFKSNPPPNKEGSTQLVADPGNRRFVQMVSNHDTAYGCGNGAYNRRAVQIELPGYSGRPYDPAVIDYCARAVAQWSADTGGAIRKLTRAEVLAGLAGVTAHEDIPDPYRPGHWGGSSGHTDPGPTFPWDQMLAKAREYREKGGGAGDPADPFLALAHELRNYIFPTGHIIHPRFIGDWLRLDGAISGHTLAAGIAVNGYPITGAFIDRHGRLVQWFERARLELHGETVMRGLVGIESWNAPGQK